MRILFVNRSGNVGKTTIAAHMADYLQAPLLSLESNKSGASIFKAVRVLDENADDPMGVFRPVLEHDPLVIDVGSGDVTGTLLSVSMMFPLVKAIDAVVVPCIGDVKVVADTCLTVKQLRMAGVPATKIVILLNQFAGISSRALKDLEDSIQEHLPAWRASEAPRINKLLALPIVTRSGLLLRELARDIDALWVEAEQEKDVERRAGLINQVLQATLVQDCIPRMDHVVSSLLAFAKASAHQEE